MLDKCIIAVFVALATLAPAAAQRVVATVSPPEGEEIRFDVNDFPITTFPVGTPPQGFPRELNFAPNVVFTPDSSRAFVSYTGSDRVLAFDARTGETLASIPVDVNPGQLTLTPDGTKLGLVSLFLRDNIPRPEDNFRGRLIGSISTIDVDTYEVRTLALQEVFFSVASNVVFSADGSTGFVASSGTDEIIRFDVATMTEMGRLEFEGGTRPVSLTMASDFSFFAAVLVGSTALDQLATPDSIQIIDPATFRVVRSIVPEPTEITRTDGTVARIPHNFFAANNLIFAADNKTALIGDQENSASTVVPELATDHALLLDLETGETLNVLGVGGVAGSATYDPVRNVFGLATAVDVTLIDPVAEIIVRATSSSSQLRPSGRPAFSADGRRVFVASPVLDLISNVDTRTGAVRNLTTAGAGFDSESEFIRAGTINVTLSPDRQLLAALNFNANTIDLLKNTVRLSVPEFLSTADFFTGVAITNNNPTQTAEIIAGGVAPTGLPYRDDPETEEVVEVVNPQTIELEPGRQISFTAAGLMEAAPGVALEGWLDLDSDVEELSGFFLTGDQDVRRLDGGLAVFDTAQTIIVPGVGIERGFSTLVSVVNTNLNSAGVVVTLINSAGEAVQQFSTTLIRAATLTRFLVDPDPDDGEAQSTLFVTADFEEGETYYLRVDSPQGVAVVVRYFDEQRMAAFNGIPVFGPDIQLTDRLYGPQVAVFGSSDSRLSLVNTNAETAQVSVSLRGDDGQDLAAPVMVELETGQSLEQRIAELFDLQDPGHTIGGWLLVEADREGVVGCVEIQVFTRRAMSAVPLQAAPASRFVFSHVAEGAGFATGLSLLNTGAEEAMVTIRVSRPDGEQLGEVSLALPAGQRLARLLSELFADLPGDLTAGLIRVESTQPLVGLELFYTTDFQLLAAVPAQPLGAVN